MNWKELEEGLLDIETTLNNRPLGYVEDDIQMPILTPHNMIVERPNLISEGTELEGDEVTLRKRAEYVQRCEDTWWSRWSAEYLKALRERHNMKNQVKEMNAKPGDVVVIKGDEVKRIDTLKKGRNGVVRAVRLRAGRSYLERTIQQLYPLKLSCDRKKRSSLNALVEEFKPRRRAGTLARENIRLIEEQENEDY